MALLQLYDPIDTRPQAPSSRVCDRCMIKKVKCNRQLPSCSRCAEEVTLCVYSCSKRKPGPAKGSRRKRPNHAIAEPGLDSQQRLLSLPIDSAIEEHQRRSTFVEELLSQQIFTDVFAPVDDLSSGLAANSSTPQGSIYTSPINLGLKPAQERQLLEDFFLYLHPYMPLFQKEPFFQRYEQGLIDQDLLVTVLAVSAQINGVATVWANSALKDCLDILLSKNSIEEEETSSTTSLDSFQQACLLAFYEFHQYPGKKAWHRISSVTRKAYQYGLHQIDNPEICLIYTHRLIVDEETEGWRSLWWCIYCLDSYCNISAGTPFVVQLESVRTALLQISQPGNNRSEDLEAIFLPAETDMLWKTTKEIVSCPGYPNANIHIVTTTLLKEAGALVRLWKQNPSDRLKSRFSILNDHLSAIRLALPIRYLEVARNVIANESNAQHHARLICILHLHASGLLLSMPIQESINSPEWIIRWQSTLEHCDEVVAVVRHWKAQHCLSVDPAICFIISSVLQILHLHSRDGANLDLALEVRLRTQIDLLRLFLEQFASIWHLPRLLITSFQEFSERFSEPLTVVDIDQLLKKSQNQLHPAWSRTVSLTQNDIQQPILQMFDQNVFSESNFGGWDSWATMSNMGFLA